MALNITTVKATDNAPVFTDEERQFLAEVIEAESDRSIPEEGEITTEGRIMIAATIINRVTSDYFPDTVNGVLTQRGQFSTVRNGHGVTDATDYSIAAIDIALERIESGEIPDNVLFFRAGHYFSGYGQYGCYGGNYFSTYGGQTNASEE